MFNRWWTYFQERFPLSQNGLLIAVFSLAAVSHSVLLRLRMAERLVEATPIFVPEQILGSILIAFVTTFLFFLQLRIADEFKDAEEDARYRSYRPVPRGLVTLKELGILGVAGAVIQLGLTLAVGLPQLLLLGLVWGYFGLMTREFFVRDWLKARPLLYLISHALITPLIALYATGCDWLAVGVAPPTGLIWFLLVSLFSGIAFEIGRKIRAPKDEEPGVETYTARWGRQKAVMFWLSSLWFSTLAGLLAGMYIRFTVPVALLLMLMLTVAVIVAWQFLIRPVTAWAKRFEQISGLWMLLLYLALGPAALLLGILG